MADRLNMAKEHSILSKITSGEPLDGPRAPAPALVQKSPFAAPTMQSVVDALEMKRVETKAKHDRLAKISAEIALLNREAIDLLNSLDA
jgi:hypothetical protein